MKTIVIKTKWGEFKIPLIFIEVGSFSIYSDKEHPDDIFFECYRHNDNLKVEISKEESDRLIKILEELNNEKLKELKRFNNESFI